MNPETLAALSPIYGLFAKFDAKTTQNFSKICNPLAGITITPEMARMCNPLAGVSPEVARGLAGITNEMARIARPALAEMEQHAKIAKLADSILRVPSRR